MSTWFMNDPLEGTSGRTGALSRVVDQGQNLSLKAGPKNVVSADEFVGQKVQPRPTSTTCM